MHLTKESEIKNCCVFIFTEKWLHNNISDTAFQLQGLTPICTVTIEALQHQVSTTLTDFVGFFLLTKIAVLMCQHELIFAQHSLTL